MEGEREEEGCCQDDKRKGGCVTGHERSPKEHNTCQRKVRGGVMPGRGKAREGSHRKPCHAEKDERGKKRTKMKEDKNTEKEKKYKK